MEELLDSCWEYIAAAMQAAGNGFYSLLEHVHFIGPAALIFVLAVLTVLVTKLLNRLIVTKRFVMLEKEFQKWFELRQEAMKCKDREKAKRLARNIDQAELNRAYYDYFFEGLLLGIARKVLPIFFMFAFINEFYRPGRMLEIFGREYVLRLGGDDAPILIGGVFWYFLSLLSCYILWSVGKKILNRRKQSQASSALAENDDVQVQQPLRQAAS